MGCQTSTTLPIADNVRSLPQSGINGKTRIVQDEIVDRCVDRPLPDEPKCHLLEEDFIDGLLGLYDPSFIDNIFQELSEEELFHDANFPADPSSLTFSNFPNPELETVNWTRPHELCEEPRLFVNGVSRSDVVQGDLGDCWFLSACAAVAKRQDLIHKVLNPSQVLFGDEYNGILEVKFWRFGEWVTVHIDDRLPTRNGKLIYACCNDPSEFWVAMIEKAYAKLHGSYEALAGGHALEAFVDLTGGIAERISLQPDLFNQLRTIFAHGAFITCSRKGNWQNEGVGNVDVKTGLVKGHAYTITALDNVVLLNGECVSLIRVRNPWGDAAEWEGAWSDESTNWKDVSDNDKKRLKVKSLPDGEFWMEYYDFQKQFQDVTVATIGPDFDQDGQYDIPRQVQIIKGSWKTNVNAGGCRNDLEKFSSNPQYLLTLKEPDDLYANVGEQGQCSVLVGLMQEHRRSVRDRDVKILPIAFFIYKTETPNEKLSAEYFLCVPEETSSGTFTNCREVIARANLEPGNYVIIPATFFPDSETHYMIRVFALRPFTLQEIQPKNQTEGSEA